MGTISLERSDHLYWLGRYTERVYTTLKALQSLYDRMIDRNAGYDDYLRSFGLADIYHSKREFMRSFLYDRNNPGSVASSLERAYDNGIVLREEITTEAFSFLQVAKDTLLKSEQSSNTRLSLLPLEDVLFGFWGCIEDKMYNEESRNIIFVGKSMERLDLYLRLKYPFEEVDKEFHRLCKVLHRMPKDTPYRYNTSYLSDLVEILGVQEEYQLHSDKAVISLGHLFEVSA